MPRVPGAGDQQGAAAVGGGRGGRVPGQGGRSLNTLPAGRVPGGLFAAANANFAFGNQGAVASRVRPFVPGPCSVVVDLGNQISGGSRPLILGYSERGVDLSVDPQYRHFQTDVCGAMAAEAIYAGAHATVSVSLVMWCEDVYAKIAAHADGDKVGDTKRGALPFRSVGTPMQLSGACFSVLAIFPYATKAAYGLPPSAMPPGYRFRACYLEREGLPSRGSSPARLDLVFRCLPELRGDRARDNTLKVGNLPLDVHVLYDNDVSVAAPVAPLLI